MYLSMTRYFQKSPSLPEIQTLLAEDREMLNLKQIGKSTTRAAGMGAEVAPEYEHVLSKTRYIQKPSCLPKRLALMPTCCFISVC